MAAFTREARLTREQVAWSPPVRCQYSPKSTPPPTAEQIAQELEITRTAQAILTGLPSPAGGEEALTALRKRRAALLTPVAANGLTADHIFFLNMSQIGLIPTPTCAAYNRLCAPTLSDYHRPGSHIALITLDAAALQYVPQEVQRVAGDLSGKRVDLFWMMIDGRHLRSIDRPVNLVTHLWAYPHLIPHDDVGQDVNMGICPEIGFQGSTRPGAIALHHMGPMRVHAHPNGGLTACLYSPDNAHFEIVPGSLFGILWAVCQKEGRIALTKMVVIFDYDNPISASLLHATKKCASLDDHLIRLPAVAESIDGYLAPLISAICDARPEAIVTLPLAFQNGVFKEVWILKGSPCDIHDDFGRLSFLADAALDARHHCDLETRLEAVTRFSAHLKHLLCDSQVDLLLHSQPLVKEEHAVEMLTCAQMVQGRQDAAAQTLFQGFTEAQKESVYFATWELSGCPRGNAHFGQETFAAARTDRGLKSQALLLAASR